MLGYTGLIMPPPLSRPHSTIGQTQICCVDSYGEPHEIQRAKESDPEHWNADDEMCSRVIWLNPGGEEYLILWPCSVHPQMFARASFIMEAIRLSDIESGRVIVKVAWRRKTRRPEAVFYSRIEEYTNEASIEITGLA
ncbi:hypothetical protein WOLCODRAFT_153336 [Wolfiporia cocos MD-104 SS10]|uniref:Fungal-type protein kinase domain-containing protein n=1 Tax=Wolfiporia cocos (strain MD-104) TaxID=742152 RepID=A0A2H3K2K7_WOLCO|nr:hypothetical protein WOLCODRAFT_153336 [Wolfiporia cocos MD-104 SS10]